MRTPHSRIRLPNIKNPIKDTERGETIPAMMVTTMGKRILVVLLTLTLAYCILIRRSCLVVISLMTGGWTMGTSAI